MALKIPKYKFSDELDLESARSSSIKRKNELKEINLILSIRSLIPLIIIKIIHDTSYSLTLSTWYSLVEYCSPLYIFFVDIHVNILCVRMKPFVRRLRRVCQFMRVHWEACPGNQSNYNFDYPWQRRKVTKSLSNRQLQDFVKPQWQGVEVLTLSVSSRL